MNKETCVICLEEIELSKKIKKWECCHTFHKDCIEHWESNCPICRNDNLILPEITFQISRNPSCPFWLQSLAQYCPVIPESESINYLNKWKDVDCINHHQIIFIVNDTGFKKNIYAICHDCNTYQQMPNITPISYSLCPLNQHMLDIIHK